MPRARNSDTQRRARAVCTRCHSRKVRCDLEAKPSGGCSRCLREGHQCNPHIGPRKRKSLRNSLARPLDVVSSPTRLAPTTAEQIAPSPYTLHECRHPTVSSYLSPNSNSAGTEPNFIHGSDLILEASHATHLPPPAMISALKDFYFSELFPLVPVLDRKQLELKDSLLLQQCVCFAGSTMRQSAGPLEWSPTAIYGRIKTLLFLRHDPDPFNMLTALCIMGTWLPYSADAIVLDSPWQWAGMAIRLGLQLHLHQKETYQHLPNANVAVRIWWHLFCSDTLQMACTGCPGMFPLEETSIPPPEVNDFDTHDIAARVFCGLVTLCKLLRKVLILGKSDNTPNEEVYSILERLMEWRDQLPTEIQLFDKNTTNRRPYNRLVAELHIFYFVTAILTFFLGRRDNLSSFTYASMVASSCISRLYEEILLHEDVGFLLPIHSWANLVAAVPRTFVDNELLNVEQAGEWELSQQVLRKIGEKHTSAALAQSRIAAIERPATVWDFPTAPLSEQERAYLIKFFGLPAEFCSMLGRLHSVPVQDPDQLEPMIAENAFDEWAIDWSSFLFDGSMVL